MSVKRVFRAFGVASASATLLLAGAPGAHADQARNAQWPLQVFKVQDRVWPLSTGKGVVVAVIDSGVRKTHADLVGQLLPEKDFAPRAELLATDDGHGTSMAAIIAGHGHGAGHADGIMGLAPGVKILPIGFNIHAADEHTEVAQAIHYAVDNGAKILNMSFGGPFDNDLDRSAIAYAEAHGVILVAGTGNEGASTVGSPARYPGVVAVGAATKTGGMWSGSNYGPQTVLAAPGADIVSDGIKSDTDISFGDGTSCATAYVSAAAALVWSKYPNLTAGQVINRLIKSAANPGSGKLPDPHFGYGILRPDAALNSNIPAGPAAGPLAQTTDSAASGGSNPTPGSSTGSVPAPPVAAAKSSSSGLLLGGIAAAVIVLLGVVAAVVMSGRRRRRAAAPAPYNPQPPFQPFTPPTHQQQPPYGHGQQPGTWPPAPPANGDPSVYQPGTGPQYPPQQDPRNYG